MLNEGSYAYEESRITKSAEEGQGPAVHTTIHKLYQFDLNEELSRREMAIRKKHRPVPNIVSFSLYYRNLAAGGNHFSIVENSFYKAARYSWRQAWNDLNDRRDLSNYLYKRWRYNWERERDILPKLPPQILTADRQRDDDDTYRPTLKTRAHTYA